MNKMLGRALDDIYESLDGSDMAMEYDARHGVESAAILTVTNDEHAELVANHLADTVRDKVIVEIGGGIGLLALHLSEYAKRIYVIESNPAWTSTFLLFFYERKPKNVTFIFGAADEMAGQLKADIALFCTHSAADAMRKAGELFAPKVIDVYGEIVKDMDVPEWLKEARQI